MLLFFPTEVLIAIVVILVVGGILFVVFLNIYNARQQDILEDEPERIKKKSDAPEIPSEGQEDKPIDETEEKLKK